MTTYAVINIAGHQYRVKEGDELFVDKLKVKKPEAKVLLVSKDGKVALGTPEVKGAKVAIKVQEEEMKGDKIYVQTFKSKSRYRRKIGFRPIYTKIEIGKITG